MSEKETEVNKVTSKKDALIALESVLQFLNNNDVVNIDIVKLQQKYNELYKENYNLRRENQMLKNQFEKYASIIESGFNVTENQKVSIK